MVATLARPADRPRRQADMDTEVTPVRQTAMAMAVLRGPRIGAQPRIRSTSECSEPAQRFINTETEPNLKNCRGHYSDAVLSSLESQNDAEVEGITAKVKMLKDVRNLMCRTVAAR